MNQEQEQNRGRQEHRYPEGKELVSSRDITTILVLLQNMGTDLKITRDSVRLLQKHIYEYFNGKPP